MGIVEIYAPAKRPMRFESADAAKDAMKKRRTGPYEYHRMAYQDTWFVARKVDGKILCDDGRWRPIYSVDTW